MFTKMMDFSKEMDAFYSMATTMMTYLEKQSRAFARLCPWMTTEVPTACRSVTDLMSPYFAALGMVSHTDVRAMEEKSAELSRHLENALEEAETHRRTIEAHQQTIDNQANHLDHLTRLNDADKQRMADLTQDLASKEKVIAAQEKKLAASAAALEEKKRAAALTEKELKKQTKYAEQMEKEIAGLKSYIESIEKTST